MTSDLSSLAKATRDELVAFFAPLWSSARFGNGAAYLRQMIEANGLETLRSELVALVWGSAPLPERWNTFHSKTMRVGPAMMSDILAHMHPASCLPWAPITQEVFFALQISKTPQYDYQLDGQTYEYLCSVAIELADTLHTAGFPKYSLLEVSDFLAWLGQTSGLLPSKPFQPLPVLPIPDSGSKAAAFLHHDMRDKLADIGRWLGLQTHVQVKFPAGPLVDTLWESTIGMMGDVLYAFEVQTSASIHILIPNLMRIVDNPAVQGVVVVSDTAQLARIKSEVAGIPELKDRLRYWDYGEVLQTHAYLFATSQSISRLGLFPQGL